MVDDIPFSFFPVIPESKFRGVQDDYFLLQAHLPWIWNHYDPQIHQPQVPQKKCHFKRKAFTTLRFHLLQNVSILYEQKTHPTKPISICKEKNQTMESIFNQKHGPNNSSSRWGLIASSGSHLLLVLLTLAGIDGGRAALMKFYPGTMSCPKLALLSLVMYPEKRCGFFV